MLFETLYWNNEVSRVLKVWKHELLGTELVQEIDEVMQKIKTKMRRVQSRQTTYVDMRRRYLEFEVDYKVFLKMSSLQVVLRVTKKGKLSLLFIKLINILKGKLSPTTIYLQGA